MSQEAAHWFLGGLVLLCIGTIVLLNHLLGPDTKPPMPPYGGLGA